MTTTEDQAPTTTIRRVGNDQLGLLITYLQGGAECAPALALDLALDLAAERARAREQADVRRALAATARAMGDQVRKGQAVSRDGQHVVGDYADRDSEHMQGDLAGGVCLDVDPDNCYGVCTRDKGHDGQHEAASGVPGLSMYVEAVWS